MMIPIPSRSVCRRTAVAFGSACLVALFLLSSCSASQQMSLKADGSGSVHFQVKIDKILMNAASSLAQGGSGASSSNEFDIPKIKEVFANKPGLNLTSLASPGPGRLSGSFTFDNIGTLFQGSDSASGGSSGSDVLSFSRSGSNSVLNVHITSANFARIAALAGMTDNPLYQMFGPEQNQATSASDLDQMMVYVLGDSGPSALKASAIDVAVKVDGTVISETGGTQKGNTVDFHIPLTRLLLLAKPLDLSITFS